MERLRLLKVMAMDGSFKTAASASGEGGGAAMTTNGQRRRTTKTSTNDKQRDDDCFWNSKFVLHYMPDPTRMFSLLVIGIMVLRFLEKHDWEWRLVVSGFFGNPYVVASLVISTAVVYFSIPRRPRDDKARNESLPVYDRWTVEWYWWNAWLYHVTMDGASGTFRAVPVVVQQYDQLDGRFAQHEVMVYMIGLIELTIMAPLCLVTIWAILQRDRPDIRYPLEIITSTLQFTGMVLFVAAEVIVEGQVHVPALDPVGIPGNAWHNLKFWDFYHFVYYWFGFWFCNAIWGVVPYIRIVSSCRAIASAFAASAKPSQEAEERQRDAATDGACKKKHE